MLLRGVCVCVCDGSRYCRVCSLEIASPPNLNQLFHLGRSLSLIGLFRSHVWGETMCIDQQQLRLLSHKNGDKVGFVPHRPPWKTHGSGPCSAAVTVVATTEKSANGDEKNSFDPRQLRHALIFRDKICRRWGEKSGRPSAACPTTGPWPTRTSWSTAARCCITW